MKNRRAYTKTRRLLFLLAALCLFTTSAGAQSSKEEFRPDAAQRAEARRLRGALEAAVGEHFEVARDGLTRRSNWHGGGVYWLAHLRASARCAASGRNSFACPF